MAQLVRVLDERKWALRCFYADLVSILMVVGMGIALSVDSFIAGFHFFLASQDPTGAALAERDVVMYRMVIEGMFLALALAWLIYRVVNSGYKSITRKF